MADDGRCCCGREINDDGMCSGCGEPPDWCSSNPACMPADPLAAALGLGGDDPDAFDTLIGEKSEKSEKRVSVPPPVADPAMYRGILTDIIEVAELTTEADRPASTHPCKPGPGSWPGRSRTCRSGTCITRC